MGISRRKFIRNTGISLAGAQFLMSCGSNELSPWKFLTIDEGKTLAFICEQIIPEDDFPGAVKAGVLNYIDNRLSSKYRDLKESYRNGLASVEKSCNKINGKNFSELSWDEQTGFLTRMEKNQLDDENWKDQKSSAFFEMVRKHTIEGYFGHPRYGGNKDFAGYRLLNYEYPELRGQNRYTDERFKNTNWKYE